MTHLTIDDMGFEPPSFSAEVICRIAENSFGVSGDFKSLRGERDQNTRITASDGRQYVLKISGATEDPQTVDFQVQALLHIEQQDSQLPVPRLIRGRDGNPVQIFDDDGNSYQVRLMSYLPGIPYAEGLSPSVTGLTAIGEFLARMNLALAGFSHPASRAFMAWDICNGLVIHSQFRDLIPVDIRGWINPLIDHIEENVYPKIESLRKQVIHQDAHGNNLLRSSINSEAVSGIIDFGDMVHGPLISDVTIPVSHFMEKRDDHADIAQGICRGFHSILPLKQEETDLLLDLVITRQILTLQLFEFRVLHKPEEAAAFPEEKPRIIQSLERLAALDRAKFAAKLWEGINQ